MMKLLLSNSTPGSRKNKRSNLNYGYEIIINILLYENVFIALILWFDGDLQLFHKYHLITTDSILISILTKTTK